MSTIVKYMLKKRLGVLFIQLVIIGMFLLAAIMIIQKLYR